VEPKDKGRCKAVISSIDWSLDSKFIVACYKVENYIVVWNVVDCKRVFQIGPQELFAGTIYLAKFYELNSQHLLLSGDKSMIIKMN
jgi:hypothetical protein